MFLSALKLTNFRNYAYQSVAFSPKLNLVTGLNGMGKTNLLDAVYYICMGKSHFSGTDRNVVKQGEEFFRLESHFSLKGKTEKIVAKVVPGKQKTFERNDNAYPRISDHVGLLPVVFMAPDDTVLALEGSEERRRFMDNTLCQLDHRYLDELLVYNKVLQNRNALLKQFGERGGYNPTLLAAYDQQLSPPGAYILEKRKQFAEQFQPLFLEYYQQICDGAETVKCHYRSQLLENDFAALLVETAEKDRLLQRTTAGIHKDDLQFYMNDLPLKRFASQGQLKSFVLCLKLAQYDLLKKEKKVAPILILDDLFDKLDDLRVAYLMGLLAGENFGQVFISDTHPERAEEIAKNFAGHYKKFIIAHAEAEEMRGET
ncbi:MAG: DNA replication and repair protein RecF [Saprospiraceae bacterium]